MPPWHPELAWDVGFQLSFAGPAAIIVLTPSIERRVRWLPHFLRAPFAVTCAAQVGTLPMMATDFHLLSPVGPLATALVLPILPAIVLAGIALGPLSLFPDVAHLAAIPLAGVLAYVEQVAYLLAKLPAAAFPVVRFPPWAGLAYYASLGAVIAANHVQPKRRALAIGGAILLPPTIAATAPGVWGTPPPAVPRPALANAPPGRV